MMGRTLPLLLLCFPVLLALPPGKLATAVASPATAPTATIYALLPDDDKGSGLVLRGARQLRMSLYALTRQLPLLPCCGADAGDRHPAAAFSEQQLLTASQVDSVISSSVVVPGQEERQMSIVFAVKGSAALDAVMERMRAVDTGGRAVMGLEKVLQSLGGNSSDDHLVHALSHARSPVSTLFCVGASPVATMYAASSALEQLGVRFHIHGDSMPRPGGHTPTLDWALSELSKLQLLQSPTMAVRGILPFHDFVSR